MCVCNWFHGQMLNIFLYHQTQQAIEDLASLLISAWPFFANESRISFEIMFCALFCLVFACIFPWLEIKRLLKRTLVQHLMHILHVHSLIAEAATTGWRCVQMTECGMFLCIRTYTHACVPLWTHHDRIFFVYYFYFFFFSVFEFKRQINRHVIV